MMRIQCWVTSLKKKRKAKYLWTYIIRNPLTDLEMSIRRQL